MEQLQEKQMMLVEHPLYYKLKNLEEVRHFMEHHVFAVWDFMSLLKALQIKLTSVAVPWRPSPHPPEIVRLINQIVLGEESDVDQDGHPTSHFALYLKAMREVGADTSRIEKFLRDQDERDIPLGAREFVLNNLELAQKGSVEEIAAAFFYGREKLIPEMFERIVSILKEEKVNAPTFLYYLERHIEVDSGEHGPLALKALSYLTGDDPELKARSLRSGIQALDMRKALWDNVLATLPRTQV